MPASPDTKRKKVRRRKHAYSPCVNASTSWLFEHLRQAGPRQSKTADAETKRQLANHWPLPEPCLEMFKINHTAGSRASSSVSFFPSSPRPQGTLPWDAPVGTPEHLHRCALNWNAAFADFNALWTSSLVDRGKTPRQSARIAGFFDSNVEPSDADSNCPPIMLYPRIIGEPLGFSLSIASNPVSSTWGMTHPPRLFT